MKGYGRSTRLISTYFFETYEAAKTDKDGELETNATGKMLTVPKAAQTSVRSAARPSQGDRAYTGKRSRQRCPAALFRLQANAELRKMLNIGGRKEQEADDVSKLSDAELIQQLANQAKELGIEIDLNYSFHKREE
jgi:hypothetical protein